MDDVDTDDDDDDDVDDTFKVVVVVVVAGCLLVCLLLLLLSHPLTWFSGRASEIWDARLSVKGRIILLSTF